MLLSLKQNIPALILFLEKNVFWKRVLRISAQDNQRKMQSMLEMYIPSFNRLGEHSGKKEDYLGVFPKLKKKVKWSRWWIRRLLEEKSLLLGTVIPILQFARVNILLLFLSWPHDLKHKNRNYSQTLLQSSNCAGQNHSNQWEHRIEISPCFSKWNSE